MPASDVLLDTSVLYPAILCDTLLRTAEAGLYRPRWSDEILRELVDNLATRIGADRAQRRVALMRQAFSTATVEGYQPLVGAMANHPADRHVLAAAVSGQAGTIVTSNLRHFPPSALSPHRIRATAPGVFLVELFGQDPERMARIVDDQAAAYVRPVMTVAELLGRLAVFEPSLPALYQNARA